MILDRFIREPERYFAIRDDVEAQALLLELGALEKIVTPVSGHQASVSIVTITDHATHIFVGLLFRGHKKAEKNGFIVRCFPKSRFPAEKIAEIIKETTDAYRDGDTQSFSRFEPHKNN